MSSAARYFVGVDVGSGSARAALVGPTGQMVRTCVRPIQTWNPQPDHYEQSSADIWRAVCECVKFVTAGHDPHTVAGIGFDATCSLVVIGADDRPLTVNASGADANQNVMMWMDHRATAQTDRINATGHRLLRHIGGQTSPEAQCPKMLWIREHLPDTWSEALYFFDLPDYLTYQSTGTATRSLCSAVAKFNYDALAGGWCADFFEGIGLGQLAAEKYARIGQVVVSPGTPIGSGLTERAARDLGLRPGTPVGASLVDAYAGGLSLFGCRSAEELDVKDAFQSRMALICGTSTGHMSIHNEPIWARGAWGPFKGVLFPGQFVHSAGQSISGILVDFIIKSHPAYPTMLRNAQDEHAHTYLNRLLMDLAQRKGLTDYHELTRDVHVWPDFHGNRSPLADPSMRGMVCGLSMSSDVDNLAVMYLAFVQALAYGTRHILESMQRDGRPPFKTLIACGGLSKNSLFLQTYADACFLPVLEPVESEMVLLGAAILGAMSAQEYASLHEASEAMAGTASVVQPRKQSAAYHQRKYAVFLRMLQDQRDYKELMTAS